MNEHAVNMNEHTVNMSEYTVNMNEYTATMNEHSINGKNPKASCGVLNQSRYAEFIPILSELSGLFDL